VSGGDSRNDTTHDDWDQGLHDQVRSELSETGDLQGNETRGERRKGGERAVGLFCLPSLRIESKQGEDLLQCQISKFRRLLRRLEETMCAKKGG